MSPERTGSSDAPAPSELSRPHHKDTDQAARSYAQLGRQPTDLAKYLWLDVLHDRNEVLYCQDARTFLGP